MSLNDLHEVYREYEIVAAEFDAADGDWERTARLPGGESIREKIESAWQRLGKASSDYNLAKVKMLAAITIYFKEESNGDSSPA